MLLLEMNQLLGGNSNLFLKLRIISLLHHWLFSCKCFTLYVARRSKTSDDFTHEASKKWPKDDQFLVEHLQFNPRSWCISSSHRHEFTLDQSRGPFFILLAALPKNWIHTSPVVTCGHFYFLKQDGTPPHDHRLRPERETGLPATP